MNFNMVKMSMTSSNSSHIYLAATMNEELYYNAFQAAFEHGKDEEDIKDIKAYVVPHFPLSASPTRSPRTTASRSTQEEKRARHPTRSWKFSAAFLRRELLGWMMILRQALNNSFAD